MRGLLRHLDGVDGAEGVDGLAGGLALKYEVPELAGHDRGRIGLLEGAALADDVGGGPVALDALVAGRGKPGLDGLDLLLEEGVLGGAGLLGFGEELKGVRGVGRREGRVDGREGGGHLGGGCRGEDAEGDSPRGAGG